MVSRLSGGNSGLLPFSDHHAYSEGDIRRISADVQAGWIATTEKDAVKLIAFRELLPEVRVLPLVAAPPKDVTERLMVLLYDRTGLRGSGK
jgi:tetraacyldisaccharide-1-P 4'-kinase